MVDPEAVVRSAMDLSMRTAWSLQEATDAVLCASGVLEENERFKHVLRSIQQTLERPLADWERRRLVDSIKRVLDAAR